MRDFEMDDLLKAASGDADALLRVERRKEVLTWNAQKRKEALQSATPLWADQEAIAAFYAEARRLSATTGVKYEVDHIIPLQVKNVCGLHVSWNLRVITKTANARKHATFGDKDVVGFLAKRGFKIIYGVNLLKRAIRFGRHTTVLYVSPEEQTVLSIAYVQGEFVIKSAPEETSRPSVLIAADS
ncbi:HNH endonuclease signature motif containing protein [Pseudomonas fluorescens]|uniref:HNH endonuclease signature motif containing protein n=1 Tax=Pseudomonas fluorescens TaxID=294 RepID=UPI00380A127A